MEDPPHPPEPLNPKDRRILADSLGDTPETVIPVHLLRQGLCRAYASGDPENFSAALIQPTEDPGEPMSFGDDASALWSLLREIEGWWCVNVPDLLATDLRLIMEDELCHPTRLYGDVYHTLTNAPSAFEHPAVRLLTPEDLPLIETAPPELRGTGFGDALLSEGIAAGAVLSGRLVSVAFTSALTARHADIGVATLEGWRGRGLATAAASLVARLVRESDRVPVWSTGEDNFASLRVARRLGFEECSRRVYVIPSHR